LLDVVRFVDHQVESFCAFAEQASHPLPISLKGLEGRQVKVWPVASVRVVLCSSVAGVAAGKELSFWSYSYNGFIFGLPRAKAAWWADDEERVQLVA
jgi:hypothetical protein